MDINLNEIVESAMQLANNAVQLAKATATKATKKTEDLVGVSKLKLDAVKLESEIKSIYQKLGAAVYDMTEKNCNDPELIDQYVAELSTKKAQLDQLNKQIAALKKTVICEACKSVNPKDAFFCSRCGAPLPATEPEDPCAACDAEADACASCDAKPEETCESDEAQEIIEQAEVDGADEQTAEQVAKDAETEE